jgi:SET domain-containing protein
VRRSRLHGRGVFALRRIRKGTRIIEYLGDRVSHREADNRYEHKPIDDNHTFLFIVDRGIVIDGGSATATMRASSIIPAIPIASR